MDDLSFLTLAYIWHFPSVREFRIPIHPDLHTKCSNNFVSVVDELSQYLVRAGFLVRGDMRFDYDFDTHVLTVIFPNRRLFPCRAEDDDPDQLHCHVGYPMRPYQTMEEAVSANPYLSLLLAQHVLARGVKLSVSTLHPGVSALFETQQLPGVARVEKQTDDSGDWWVAVS